MHRHRPSSVGVVASSGRGVRGVRGVRGAGVCVVVMASVATAFVVTESRAWAAPPAAPAADEQTLELTTAKLVLRRIPKGAFSEGSPTSESLRESDEDARPVTISSDFWMGKYPVTRGQFAAFVADTKYVTEAETGKSGGYGWDGHGLVQKKEYTWKNPGFPQTDEHPVVLVTFADATAFVNWAGTKTGRRVRLPTEAEWEYAARAGTQAAWYGGSSVEDAASIGWFKSNSLWSTHPVGQKKPNAFGLFDMAGNVEEWCRDVYAPYGKTPAVDPESVTAAPGEPERRVLRGGSWLKDAKRSRSAARFRSTPGSRNADIGFRIVVGSADDALMPGSGSSGSMDFAPSGLATLGGNGANGASPRTTPAGGSGEVTSAGEKLPSGASSAAPAGRGEDGTKEAVRPEGASWGGLLWAPLGAAAAVVAWMLLRKKRGSSATEGPRNGPMPSGLPDVTVREGVDGFWIRAPRAPKGSRARFRCMVHGSEVLDETKLDGRDETFFYTGGRPSAIRVLEIFPPDEARNGKKSSQQKMRSPSSSSSSGPVVRDEVTSFGDRESPRPMVVPFVEAQGPIGTPSGGGSSGGGGSTDAWGDSGSGGSSDSSGSDFLGHPRAY